MFLYGSVVFRSLLSILCKIHLCFCMCLLCLAVCSLFYVLCVVLCYVSVMFGSLLCILCFLVCFMLCFCYVLPLLSTLCFWSLCMFCFQYVSQFALYLSLFDVLCLVLCFASVMFLFKIWITLCFSSMFLLCFRFFFFLLRFWLKLFFVLFFYLSVMFVMLICFLLCFFLCFHSALQCFFCFICIMLNSDLFSYVFLLGFCLYAFWQHQICSSIWQSLEFAKSVGIWVGKSATSVPSLSRKNILDKYWPVPVQNTGQ